MGVPMPEELRRAARQSKDPALAVSCDHCLVDAGKPCKLRLSGRLLPAPHPTRQDKAAAQRARLGGNQPGREEA